MEKKEQILSQLDEICEGVMAQNGTLFTEVFALDRYVERKIEDCYSVGIERVKIMAILSKYQSE